MKLLQKLRLRLRLLIKRRVKNRQEKRQARELDRKQRPDILSTSNFAKSAGRLTQRSCVIQKGLARKKAETLQSLNGQRILPLATGAMQIMRCSSMNN